MLVFGPILSAFDIVITFKCKNLHFESNPIQEWDQVHELKVRT